MEDSADRRGISWKDQTLASVSEPPAPLMVICGVVFILLYFATHSDYRAQAERGMVALKLLFFLSPLIMILVVHVMMLSERWFHNARASRWAALPQSSGETGWLAAAVLVLLVLVYYHSQIKSSVGVLSLSDQVH